MCMELGGSATKDDVLFPASLAVTPVYHLQKVTEESPFYEQNRYSVFWGY